MLHLLTYTLDHAPALLSQYGKLTASDAVVLLGDGVYLATKAMTLPVKLYALYDAVVARGLTHRLQTTVCLIDYRDLVVLTEDYTPIYTW